MLHLLTVVASSVFNSSSANFKTEVATIARLLALAPGKTYCEIGGANGRFLVALGHRICVDQGSHGRVWATGISGDIPAMQRAAADAGLHNVTVSEASDDVCGLPAGACDAILIRMVYHMLPQATAQRYLPQLSAALRPSGRLLVLDHPPTNAGTTRADAKVGQMRVVPQPVEVEEFSRAGFYLARSFNWSWFPRKERGFALLWTHDESAARRLRRNQK
jgi:SAM-dependent methyltransferase